MPNMNTRETKTTTSSKIVNLSKIKLNEPSSQKLIIFRGLGYDCEIILYVTLTYTHPQLSTCK